MIGFCKQFINFRINYIYNFLYKKNKEHVGIILYLLIIINLFTFWEDENNRLLSC